MKIAIASRGLVRSPWNNSIGPHDTSSVMWCVENLNILKGQLGDHEIKTFFCSWKYANAIEYAGHFDTSLLLDEPSHKESYERLPRQPMWFRDPGHYCHGTSSLYKFFHQSRELMKTVKSADGDFDYIIAYRPDLRIKMGNISEWFNGDYVIPGMSCINFNDHINIAPAKSMYDVWDYSDEELLAAVDKSLDTEDVLKNLVLDSGLNFSTNVNIQEYKLRNFDVRAHYHAGGYEAMRKQLLGKQGS